jgi:hypothetical protein
VVLEAHPIPRVDPQEDRVAHLGLCEFEPLGQHDARPVLFWSLVPRDADGCAPGAGSRVASTL